MYIYLKSLNTTIKYKRLFIKAYLHAISIVNQVCGKFQADPQHEKSKRTPDEELQTNSEDAISALDGKLVWFATPLTALCFRSQCFEEEHM